MKPGLTTDQLEILDLRDQVYDLQQENAALIAAAKERLSAGSVAFTHDWRLTRSERQMLAAFAASKDWSVSKQDLHAAIRRDRHTEQKIVDVIVCKLRKKLAPFGVVIDTVWGFGYQISPSSSAAFLVGMTDTAESLLAKNTDTSAIFAASAMASADNSKSDPARA